jgi:hypothetical protein
VKSRCPSHWTIPDRLLIVVVIGDYIVNVFLLVGLGNEVLRRLQLFTLLFYQKIIVIGFRNSVIFDLHRIFHKR